MLSYLALFLILFVATRSCDQCFKPVLRGNVLNLDSLKDLKYYKSLHSALQALNGLFLF